MSEPKTLRKVHPLFRMLAGLISFGFVFMMLDLSLDWIRFREWPFSWSPVESLLYIPAILLGAYLFGFVAYTGKSPRLITSLEDEWSKLESRSSDEKRKNSDGTT